MLIPLNYKFGEAEPPQTLEMENKILYFYMKDNITWRTSFDEDTKVCKFHNPLNTAAYGLLFDKDINWLHEVLDKIGHHFQERQISLYLKVSLIPELQEFCIHADGVNSKGFEVELAHEHGKTQEEAVRKVVIKLVQQITTGNN